MWSNTGIFVVNIFYMTTALQQIALEVCIYNTKYNLGPHRRPIVTCVEQINGQNWSQNDSYSAYATCWHTHIREFRTLRLVLISSLCLEVVKTEERTWYDPSRFFARLQNVNLPGNRHISDWKTPRFCRSRFRHKFTFRKKRVPPNIMHTTIFLSRNALHIILNANIGVLSDTLHIWGHIL